ncbi:MAG: hypothetical protein HXX15_05770 [Rhodopseudomonas sp.]|uniref:hypothetical protein n=1 Tax=Rhodopseudomonas sp. TaxID=1078 RepID=UPI0017D178AC|nr:hypothetical protein [Rhodopseudomonas sp.]NVN85580.1 hypothetical protein [Rhodopseudomonas sp.]
MVLSLIWLKVLRHGMGRCCQQIVWPISASWPSRLSRRPEKTKTTIFFKWLRNSTGASKAAAKVRSQQDDFAITLKCGIDRPLPNNGP